MINREIIRLKVVQITYAYYQNGGKNIDTAEKELFFSLAKAYDLYNYLLTLMVEINRIAERAVETAQKLGERGGFCAFVVQANYRDGLLQRIYGVGRVFLCTGPGVMAQDI